MASGDMDAVLRTVGQFGRYQGIVFLLLGVAMMFMAGSGLSYVFTAGVPDYRCRVPACDDMNPPVFNPGWLPYAVDKDPSHCARYQMVPDASGCTEDNFLNTTEICSEWIFSGEETTIVDEWGLTCQWNAWKLALVGTCNCLGQLVGSLLAGIASDRFGRRTVLMFGVLMSCLLGMAQTLSPNYYTFIGMEFVHNLVGGSVLYSLVYVLGMELTGKKYRVVAGLLAHLMMGLGEALLGLFAWGTRDWRRLLQVIHGFGFVVLAYLWWMPESVRWLAVQGRVDDAIRILKRTAKINGKKLSKEDITKLTIAMEDLAKEGETREAQSDVLGQVIRSKQIILRLAICSFLRATSSFVYYGLSLQSVSESLTGNKYLNFIVTSVAEIPGCLILYPLLNSWLGRRTSQSLSLALTATFCLLFTAVPEEYKWVNVTLFLLGKMVASISYGVLEIFTVELFPTEVRNSLYGVFVTVGRTGTITAQQVSLLTRYLESLPLILFGVACLISALLALLLPETKNAQFPDTIKEAEDIGRKSKKKKKEAEKVPPPISEEPAADLP